MVLVRSLRESKAKLSELVDLASRGQDGLISVRGRVKARLTRASPAGSASSRSAWLRELRALHRATGSGRRTRLPIEQIVAHLREDRL